MDKAQADELDALFDSKWGPLALACLHDGGPMRWTQVRHAISERTGTSVSERATTRALHALQRLGLARTVDGNNNRNHLYALTPQGIERARWVQQIFARLTRPPEKPDTNKPSDAPSQEPDPDDPPANATQQ